MGTQVTEVERRYESSDTAPVLTASTLERLTGTAGSLVGRQDRLSAVYYDTQDLALLDAGMTLRRREGGEDAGWHLKVPTGADTRIESRLPPDGPDDDIPGELRSLVRATVRHATLAAVARIDTDRTLHRWTDTSGAPIVDVVVDRVSATDLRPHGSAQRWTEIEVELGRGGRELLSSIESHLAGLGLHRSATRSKLARALCWVAPSTTPPPSPAKATAGELVRTYLATQVAAIVKHDVGVRLDLPDAVHRTRVAIRRLRSTFRVFRAVLDPSVTTGLGDELRLLCSRLGGARDAEVQLARFATATPDPLDGRPWALLAEHFQQRQERAKADAVAALDSDEYVHLLDRLDALVTDPPFTELAEHPASLVLPRMVRHAYASVRRDLAAAERCATVPDRDVAVHRARRAAKRARYATELISPLRPRRAAKCVAACARFQDVIGEYQDSVVAGDVLSELTRLADQCGVRTFGYGRLYERELTIRARIAPGLGHEWRCVAKLAAPLFRSHHH